ncbi:hypothetical protein MNBD_GAMMA09-2794 [hydrothermal vent metagenome]|uniref:Uncharacterized protein n=1 Tax=hydrothermal vent metagenome TaxID=652676 RepID=A0A3B0XLM5_9ZZZZ
MLVYGAMNSLCWGVNKGISIMQDEPKLQSMVDFFHTQSNWVYFSGHHISGHLFNHYPQTATAGARFFSDSVKIYTPDGRQTLNKNQGFMMHTANPQVLFWGGCNVCENPQTVQVIRNLFNFPLILGYSGSSGWKLTHKIFTGRHIGPDGKRVPHLRGDTDFFYELSKGSVDDLVHVRNSWLRTARLNFRGNMRQMYRAIDPSGQEWLPGADKKEEGRCFSRGCK